MVTVTNKIDLSLWTLMVHLRSQWWVIKLVVYIEMIVREMFSFVLTWQVWSGRLIGSVMTPSRFVSEGDSLPPVYITVLLVTIHQTLTSSYLYWHWHGSVNPSEVITLSDHIKWSPIKFFETFCKKKIFLSSSPFLLLGHSTKHSTTHLWVDFTKNYPNYFKF
jgi:hypothetical protein